MVPTKEQVERIAPRVMYEWQMLHSMRFISPQCNGNNPLSHATLESFLVHARNLYDFFFKERKYDDVLVVDFYRAGDFWSTDQRKACPYIRDNYERLNKSLSHLTYWRIKHRTVQWDFGRWNIGLMHKELLEMWLLFWKSLSYEQRQCFQSEWRKWYLWHP